ncbi:hypothetical protein [Amycolatopsis solani]|uniref:hypothetical protein n=1 Tax=Amycolatopsis solani TaxID=3028615 RepID=UPI0025B2390A|nr:hypothetical protein [Amycolatopsis sp. MEP2-6]
MRKILVIAAAGAALAVGGTTAALAQSGADDGRPAPSSTAPVTSAATWPAPSTYPTRTHDLGDDHGGRTAEPGDDRGGRTSSSTYPTRTHDLGDDHGGRGAEPGDDHGRHGRDH